MEQLVKERDKLVIEFLIQKARQAERDQIKHLLAVHNVALHLKGNAVARTAQRTIAEAEARGILCCAVDDPARSNFIVPAVLRRGDLVVTVSTSGVAPALAARLRDFIGEILGDEYAEVLDRLRLAREELKSRYPDFEERREAWYRLLDTEILPALQRGERPRANTDEDGRARLQPSRYGTTKARASAPGGPHQLVMTDTSAAKASLVDTCSSGTAEPAPSRVTDAPRSADESGKEIATTPQPERAKS